VSLLWTTFYLIAIDLPARRVSPAMARPLRSAPVPAPRPPLRAAMAGRRGSVPGDSVRAVSSTRR
jgi:hypothetical protein